MRLGLSTTLGHTGVDPEIVAAVEAAAGRLADAGAIVDVVDIEVIAPQHEAAWMTLWAVFMASYYGDTLDEHRQRMDPEVVRLIEAGHQVSAVDYKRLELVRTDLWRRLAAVLADHDALLCPTMARSPLLAAKADQRAREAADGVGPSPAMTSEFNLVPQCPIVSVPVGSHTRPADAGLPIGMQVVGRRWQRRRGPRDRSRRRAHAPLTARSAASSSGVAAPTGVRRASWSRTTRSRPRASTTGAPTSAQISDAAR